MIRFWILILVILFSSDLYAQRKKNKRTTINFEDQLIEGSSQTPDLFFLMQRGNFDFSKLIKLRDNFLPEMRRSAGEIVVKRVNQEDSKK